LSVAEVLRSLALVNAKGFAFIKIPGIDVGRAKLMMKPGGYEIFPGDVENHFCALEQVASCAAVGVEHAIISEAIVAFVERNLAPS
jgi:acyl-coenzyme A synthetase/AMP-(fatty) acid ligase